MVSQSFAAGVNDVQFMSSLSRNKEIQMSIEFIADIQDASADTKFILQQLASDSRFGNKNIGHTILINAFIHMVPQQRTGIVLVKLKNITITQDFPGLCDSIVELCFWSSRVASLLRLPLTSPHVRLSVPWEHPCVCTASFAGRN